MDVSIVIPLYNESESLIELNEWINKSLISSGFSYEIIYIDDGSDDQSWNIIEDIAKENDNVKGISFSRNFGKSQALRVGFYESKGDYVATLDADLQDSPEEIPIMIDKLIKNNLDKLSDWKNMLEMIPNFYSKNNMKKTGIAGIGEDAQGTTLYRRAGVAGAGTGLPVTETDS